MTLQFATWKTPKQAAWKNSGRIKTSYPPCRIGANDASGARIGHFNYVGRVGKCDFRSHGIFALSCFNRPAAAGVEGIRTWLDHSHGFVRGDEVQSLSGCQDCDRDLFLVVVEDIMCGCKCCGKA